MTKPRKFLITVLLLISTLVPAWATGMPVIDITAIANAIAEFSTTVQQYQKQVMQWKSEYDRLARAAKSIAKGDFDSILSGISQAATAISGYNESLSGFAEIAAAANLGRKVARDTKQMTNSVESTWASFLHKMNSTDSAEDAIDVLWDVVALTPVSGTFAASDILTKDVLTDSYMKKLKNDEKRADLEEKMAPLAEALKERDERAETLAATKEALDAAEETKKKAYTSWTEAQKSLTEATQKLQASIKDDGDTESNQTRELRAAKEAAEITEKNAHNAYIEAQNTYDSLQPAVESASRRYADADSIVEAKKKEADAYVAITLQEEQKKSSVSEALEKSGEEYQKIQDLRWQAYRKANTYNPIPRYIPDEAYASEAAFSWYLKSGTMEGFK